METPSTLARIAGSTVVGALGFAVGFYGGVVIVLGTWGLTAGELAFVFIAGGLGTLVGGAGVAMTVSSPRRWAAFITHLGLGIVMLLAVLVFDADAAAMSVGGLILVTLTSILVRTGRVAAITS